MSIAKNQIFEQMSTNVPCRQNACNPLRTVLNLSVTITFAVDDATKLHFRLARTGDFQFLHNKRIWLKLQNSDMKKNHDPKMDRMIRHS
jgi:hypothetical protein